MWETILSGALGECTFQIGDETFTRYYWLVDGIYPEYCCFAKAVHEPITPGDRAYVSFQECVRKDIERFFGVLEQRWKVLRDPCRFHMLGEIIIMVKACVILHNMIVEGQLKGLYRDADEGQGTDIVLEFGDERRAVRRTHYDVQSLIVEFESIADKDEHYRLRRALMGHHLARSRGHAQ